MMTIILGKEKGETVKSISNEDNGKYLFTIEDHKNFPIMSEFADCDNEMVLSKDIPQLIKELQFLKNTLNEKDSQHINEIIELAESVKENREYYLIFTPFIEPINKTK